MGNGLVELTLRRAFTLTIDYSEPATALRLDVMVTCRFVEVSVIFLSCISNATSVISENRLLVSPYLHTSRQRIGRFGLNYYLSKLPQVKVSCSHQNTSRLRTTMLMEVVLTSCTATQYPFSLGVSAASAVGWLRNSGEPISSAR